jgi:hypothetical protein
MQVCEWTMVMFSNITNFMATLYISRLERWNMKVAEEGFLL